MEIVGSRARAAPWSWSRLALLVALASPVPGAAQGAPSPMCDQHPKTPMGELDKVLESTKGLDATQFAAVRDIAPAIELGGADCSGIFGEKLYPVGVITRNGTQHCTGTLIAPRVVLTAAHCVYRYEATQLEFRVGPDGSKPLASAAAYASLTHVEYDPKRHGVKDVAVLYLDKEMKGVTAVDFRRSKYDAPPVDQLTFIGYGNPGSDIPGRRRCLQLLVKNVCAGSFDYIEPDRHPCRGDSGGPALEQDGGRFVLAGVTSWGTEDCNRPGVSMDVGGLYYFVRTAIADAPPPPPPPFRPRAWVRWTPVAAAGLAAGLGIYGYTQSQKGRQLHHEAVGMINPDGTLNTDAATYNQKVAASESAHARSTRAGYMAAGMVVVTGVLSYVSYRYSGEVGPFRF